MLRADPEPVKILMIGALQPNSTAAVKPASWPRPVAVVVLQSMKAR
jgi:hypothetical protein